MSEHDRVWRGVQWAVSKKGLESLDGEVLIPLSDLISFKSRATPETLARWPIEMAGTIGINLSDFTTAWLVAIAFNSFDEVMQDKLLEGIRLAQKKRMTGGTS